MVHAEFQEQPVEETLELVWRLREEGEESLERLLEKSRETEPRALVDRMIADGLLSVEGGAVRFEPAGEELARAVVRRHRLAERLLCDLFDLPLRVSDRQACLMEHVLSPVVTEAVCAFLGHPPTCPHGWPIPQGACCTRKGRRALEPVVIPLPDLEPGSEARIVFIVPGVEKRLDRLGSFGIVPGSTVTLRQKRPSFVVETGGTTLALESEIAREIYVRREG